MVQKYIFYLVISVTSDYNFVTTEYFLLKNDKAHLILTLFNLVLLYWLHHITKQIAFLTNKTLQYFYINEKYCRALFFIFQKRRERGLCQSLLQALTDSSDEAG